jgi:hypothetical protein
MGISGLGKERNLFFLNKGGQQFHVGNWRQDAKPDATNVVHANAPLIVSARSSSDKNQNEDYNGHKDNAEIFGTESVSGFG